MEEKLDIRAVPENLPRVLEFIGQHLESSGCSRRAKAQIDVAVEEIFVNISSYAYDPDIGIAQIRVETRKEPLSVVMSFIDGGKPYDPLANPEPDLKIPLKERKKGGLGIFMVRKTMDCVEYEYRDGQNILTVTKNIG